MLNAFRSLPMNHGVTYADFDPLFGSRVTAIAGGGHPCNDDSETNFVYCAKGTFDMYVTGVGQYTLREGMYGCLRKGFVSAHPTSYGFSIAKPNYKGLFMFGGPVEDLGRLKYIDGCTDSLLIPPVMKGDPCFNLLVFPPGIDQTMHTHPSVRIGMVIRGHGQCRQLDAAGEESRVDLFPGRMFAIQAEGAHAFSTPFDEGMAVVAYHPDSDFGPTHEEHPMLNRTIIDGVSASDPSRAQYRTK